MRDNKEFSQAVLAFGAGVFTCLFVTVLLGFEQIPEWCSQEDTRCLREWLSALSGWVAAAGAGFTIVVLWMTLEHMRHSTQQQLRAYVYISRCRLVNAEFNQPIIECTIKNYGQTPAYYTETFGSFYINTSPEELDFSESKMRSHVIPPSAEKIVNFTIQNPPNSVEILQIDNGMLRAGFTAKLKYLDAFSRRHELISNFYISQPLGFADGGLAIRDVSEFTK